MVQPEAWGDIPFGPVSWNGVASPGAVSGLAGTMRTQLTLAAAAAGVAEAWPAWSATHWLRRPD
jgi:hypothetical protein